MKKKLNILVVEDNEEYRKAAQLGLPQDVIVDFTRDFEEAKEKLDSEEYDVVISDLLFPEETGSGKKKLGTQVTYGIVKQLQNKIKIENTEGEFPKITEEEFGQLIKAAKEIKQIFDERKEDSEIKGLLSPAYDGVGEGEFLKDVFMGYYCLWEKLRITENKKEEYKRLNELLGRFADSVIGAVFSLVSQDEDLQPLGFRIAKIAEKRRIPYLLLSSGAHRGYGSGIQNLLCWLFGEKVYAHLSTESWGDEMTERVLFAIGDKHNPEIWRIATRFILC